MKIRILLAAASILLLGACTPSEDSTLTSQEQSPTPETITTEATSSSLGPAAVDFERLLTADTEEAWGIRKNIWISRIHR